MPIKEVDTIVVGAGQAGIAMSEHLTANGIDHLILKEIALQKAGAHVVKDSLVANGPAWHDRFPSLDFEGHSGEDFCIKRHRRVVFRDLCRTYQCAGKMWR